ncbi:MAG: hypothetical protein WA840_21725 [Caulobacteraceae bacterium]
MSEHHHKLIRAFAVAEHLAFQREDERCLARVRLQELVLPAIPLAKVRDRQNAQRLKGNRPLAALSSPAPRPPEHGIPVTTLTGRTDGGVAHRAPGRTKQRRVRTYEAKPRALDATPVTGATPLSDLFEPPPTPAVFEEFFPGPPGREGA